MKLRMCYCYNIQNTDQPYLFSLIQIKIVRKIYVSWHVDWSFND